MMNVLACFRGSVSVEGRGVGTERPAALEKDDDEFDAYRKRMMLAYRFRPNPLVSLFCCIVLINRCICFSMFI